MPSFQLQHFNAGLLIIVLALTSLLNSASAFTINAPVRAFAGITSNELQSSSTVLQMKGVPTVLVDGNGKEFTKDCTVQTTKEMKAYQVAKKGYGSFDGTTFVPLDVEDAARKDSCLVMPKGIRGVVNRVYKTDEFDTIMPIVVKFKSGESMGGEFEPPLTFLMHLEEGEVEVVEQE
jgi:hypothetical protein